MKIIVEAESIEELKKLLSDICSKDKKPEGIHLSQTNLTLRTLNCLLAEKIQTVDDLSKMSRSQLLKLPNFGKVSLNDVDKLLRQHGYVR